MKKFLPEYSDAERLDILVGTAESIEEETYFRPLTKEDIEAKNESFVINAIEISKHDDTLDEAKQIYKENTKPLKEENTRLLNQIKTRQEKVVGKLYNIADQEEGTMTQYDEKGNFVSSRRLRQSERQMRIFSLPQQVNE